MRLVESSIRPTRVRALGERWIRYSSKRFDQVVASADLELLEVEGEAGAMLCSEFAGNGFWQIVVDLPTWPQSIGELTTYDGFAAALVGDDGDRLAQSETSPSNYRALGLDLTTEQVIQDEQGRHVVDISEHWGRASIGPGMWFWAAATMWFGRLAFDVIDRERLVQFEGAAELADGIVRVDLFDPDWPIQTIRERQRRFREQLDYDRLEHIRPGHLVAPSDPHMQIDKRPGTEQVQRVVEWFDDDDQPQPRSRATRRRTTEFDEDGSGTTWIEPS